MARRRLLPRWFRGIAPQVRAHRRWLLLAIGAAAAGQALALGLPLLVRRPLAALTQPETDRALPGWPWLAAAGALFSAVRAGLTWMEVYYGNRFAQAVLHDVRQRLLAGLVIQPQSKRGTSGAMVLRFIGDAGALQTWLARTCVLTPADVLTLCGVAGAIGWLYSPLLGLLLTVVLITGAIALRLNRPIRRYTREMRREQSRLAAAVLAARRAPGEREHGAACPDSNSAQAVAAQHIGNVRAAGLGRARREAALHAVVVAGYTATLAGSAAWGAVLVAEQRLALADLAAVVWLLVLARAPAIRLTRGNVLHQRARVARRRIRQQLRAAKNPSKEAADAAAEKSGAAMANAATGMSA